MPPGGAVSRPGDAKARYAVDHHVAERAALVDLPHMHGHQRCAKTHCKFIRKPNATNQLKGIINVFHHNSEVGMHHHLQRGLFVVASF